jgi:hypothetical protein
MIFAICMNAGVGQEGYLGFRYWTHPGPFVPYFTVTIDGKHIHNNNNNPEDRDKNSHRNCIIPELNYTATGLIIQFWDDTVPMAVFIAVFWVVIIIMNMFHNNNPEDRDKNSHRNCIIPELNYKARSR